MYCLFVVSFQVFCPYFKLNCGLLFMVGEPRSRKGRGQRMIKVSLRRTMSFSEAVPPPAFSHILLSSHTFFLVLSLSQKHTCHMTLLSSFHCPNSLPAFPAELIPGCLHLPSLACSLLFLTSAHFIKHQHLPFPHTAFIKITKGLSLTGAASRYQTSSHTHSAVQPAAFFIRF